jgi:hypothetical protein
MQEAGICLVGVTLSASHSEKALVADEPGDLSCLEAAREDRFRLI